MRGAATLVCAGLGLLLPSSVLAQPTDEPASDGGPSAAARPGLDAAAAALREHVRDALEGCEAGSIALRPRASIPAGAPRARALVADLLEPTLAMLREDPRFGERAHVVAFDGSGEEAAERARRLGYRTLVDVDVHVAGSFLTVSGARHGAPEDRSFSLRERLDVSLRRYVGFPSRVTEETVVSRAARLPGSGYLAVAVHDLDGDGRAEIVGVTSRGAEVMRLGASRVGVRIEPVGDAPWPSDVGPAPAPPRRSLATALPVGDAVVARLGDLAAPVRIALVDGAVTTTRADGPCPDDRFPIPSGCGRLVDGRDFFDDLITRGSEPHEPPAHFYAYAAGRFETAAGDVVEVEATITVGGRLAARVRQQPAAGGPAQDHTAGAVRFGTALAMSDLDLDGSPELLVSHSTGFGEGDQLSLLRALPRGAVQVVWRSEPIAGPIWVAAAGDVDGDGLDELVAIEESLDAARRSATLWIVR